MRVSNWVKRRATSTRFRQRVWLDSAQGDISGARLVLRDDEAKASIVLEAIGPAEAVQVAAHLLRAARMLQGEPVPALIALLRSQQTLRARVVPIGSEIQDAIDRAEAGVNTTRAHDVYRNGKRVSP